MYTAFQSFYMYLAWKWRVWVKTCCFNKHHNLAVLTVIIYIVTNKNNLIRSHLFYTFCSPERISRSSHCCLCSAFSSSRHKRAPLYITPPHGCSNNVQTQQLLNTPHLLKASTDSLAVPSASQSCSVPSALYQRREISGGARSETWLSFPAVPSHPIYTWDPLHKWEPGTPCDNICWYCEIQKVCIVGHTNLPILLKISSL